MSRGSGSAISIPDENLKLFVPLRQNLGNIEFSLALRMDKNSSLMSCPGVALGLGVKTWDLGV